jgi:hypothetical protein
MEAVLVALSGRLSDQKLKALIKGSVLTLCVRLVAVIFIAERSATRL